MKKPNTRNTLLISGMELLELLEDEGKISDTEALYRAEYLCHEWFIDDVEELKATIEKLEKT